MSRNVKNITVSVPAEIYREARILAAEYDSTVSAFVAFLLPRMRVAIERAHFPKGGPKANSQPSARLTPAVNDSVTPPTLPPRPTCPPASMPTPGLTLTPTLVPTPTPGAASSRSLSP